MCLLLVVVVLSAVVRDWCVVVIACPHGPLPFFGVPKIFVSCSPPASTAAVDDSTSDLSWGALLRGELLVCAEGTYGPCDTNLAVLLVPSPLKATVL